MGRSCKGFHWEKKKVLENSIRDRRDEMLYSWLCRVRIALLTEKGEVKNRWKEYFNEN